MFGRLLTAMATPFTTDQKIDLSQAEKLAKHLIRTGTDTIVINGTTAESPSLTATEKTQMIQTIKTAVPNAKLIANIGSNNTSDSVDFLKLIENESKVDGYMVVAPYYNKPNPRGIIAHFKEIASHTNKPIMAYNVPSRTGINFSLETLLSLSDISNVTHLKEATGDLEKVALLKKHRPDFTIYSGDDPMTLPMMAVGASGVVSVASHIVGARIKAMMHYLENGKHQEALAIHQELLPIFTLLFKETNPISVKKTMNMLGFQMGKVRLPLSFDDTTYDNVYNDFIQSFKKTNPFGE